MNKPLRRIAVFCGILIMALLVRVNWVQFVQADELQSDDRNRRVAVERYAHPRGDIIVEGKAVTGSTETDGSDYQYKRTHKNGPVWAPVTGRASQAFGTSMLEGVYDEFLTGTDDRLFFNRTIDMLTGKPMEGGNVVTTLNAEAQRAAFEGLGDKKGAVAAIDPQTGAILALASTPSYDPSAIAGNSKEDEKKWVALNDDPDKPMLNRALRETYPPGSTFKVVTAAAALESGRYDIDKPSGIEDPYQLPQSTDTLSNYGSPPCDDATLKVALQYSCNATFAGISHELGNEKMIEVAEKFGYNTEHFVPIRSAESVYPEDNQPQNAQAGIGQASNRATPLQMAMVTAAIANDGKLMKPYMVDRLEGPRSVVEQTEPEELGQPLSATNAGKLQDMMENVVENGTGTNGRLDGVTVGGKTGTAQRGVDNSESPYAWFISYAMTDGGSPVAVAVVVEDSNAQRDEISGGGLAAPIAKDVMRAVLDGRS
ncbi:MULTISPECIES: peptidoglycan D,D-transpeptidase FtsI family protein [Streptomyces]|uniref:peptidoglycan D,D-transpeptidase FtsI family protein n=1 Tax=Streptomyces TaxID=1883 RepID=UPI0022493592|nr:penicillin-binding transpeptidase domain-containing protein [Streptomyces sp. JHD 1]MCX2967997.1 penicillin-binding transpeptidase domain-containing protein [Streptomyces sp. JHD 1]